MIVNWNKCQGDVWCPLNTVNLEHSHFDNMWGVYIIWHAGPNAATVRVGKGFIKDMLREHRVDLHVQQYKDLTLYVTWASVSAAQRDGVERYLAETLNPKVRTHFPNAPLIDVNLPW